MVGGDWCNFFVCRILRNFLSLLYFFLITSIFSRLSAEVVVGVLIQSNERRDNSQQKQPTSSITPCIRSSLWRPCHWDGAIIGAELTGDCCLLVLSGDLCWFLRKKLWYFSCGHSMMSCCCLIASVQEASWRTFGFCSTDTSHSLRIYGSRGSDFLIGRIGRKIIIGPGRAAVWNDWRSKVEEQ